MMPYLRYATLSISAVIIVFFIVIIIQSGVLGSPVWAMIVFYSATGAGAFYANHSKYAKAIIWASFALSFLPAVALIALLCAFSGVTC